MKTYQVRFSYSIFVDAKTKTEAIEKAIKIWDDTVPLTDEMNIEIDWEDMD